MRICRWVPRFDDVQDIIRDDTQCYDNTLARFDSIDSRKDIDGVGAKDAQERHVSVV
jgi:hypothetical protein